MQEISILAVAFLLAAFLGIIMRRWRQPLIVSYVASGAILSALGLVRTDQIAFLKFLPEIGLAFLLFLVGMELNLGEFKSLGKNVLLATVMQVLISTLVLTLLVKSLLGANNAWLLGISFSFSSTILVVKLLLESKELTALHGKLAVGILLLEDLIAIGVLMFLSTVQSRMVLDFNSVGLVLIKGALLISLAIFAGRKILPKTMSWTAENGELLFLSAIGWCLLFVTLALTMGFSTGIGAFLAGVALAQSVYRIQISGKVKPLRDFFIMIFFIDLGIGLFPLYTGFSLIVPLLLMGYILVFKPLILFMMFVLLRFRVHTAFRTAVLLSSISEFSLIILYLIRNLNLVGPEIVSPLAFATILSFVFSSLLITNHRKIYRLIGGQLKRIESSSAISFDFLPRGRESFRDHAVLVGCHRSGEIILKGLKRIFGDKLVVVDFNPDVITHLKETNISCVFGDISDPEIAEILNLNLARVVISTIRDVNDNVALLDHLKKISSKAIIITTAADSKEALILYNRGAHHVSLPLALEGISINHLIAEHQNDLSELIELRERKIDEVKKMQFA